MKVLVVGSGGREHALAWKIAQSERVTQTFVAPGNAGTAAASDPRTCLSASVTSRALRWITEHQVGLVVVGPEAPLVDGPLTGCANAASPSSARTQTGPCLRAQRRSPRRSCPRRRSRPHATRAPERPQTSTPSAMPSMAPRSSKADGLAGEGRRGLRRRRAGARRSEGYARGDPLW